VYCAGYADSSSGLNVVIDGVSVGTACGVVANSVTAFAPVFSAPSGLGAHSAVLTSNSTGYSYLYGAEWTVGSRGISVHNLAVGGAIAEFYGTNAASQLGFSDLIGSGTQLAVALLGTNEPGLGASLSSYSAALKNLIRHEQSLGASVLIIAPPPLGTSQGWLLPGYQAAARQIANTTGAAYMDFSQWGTFAQANANQLYESDRVHLNDNGQNALFQILAGGVLGYNTASPFNGGDITNTLNITARDAIPMTVANPVPTQVSAILFGDDSCNANHAFWEGETGSAYTYSVPNAFVLFDCINGQFPFLVFPSGNISISGSAYGRRNTGTNWSIPVEKGVSLQVAGGLSTDSFTIAAASPQPSCTASLRGTFWFVQAATGASDSLQVCAKGADDTYSWKTVF
jgi:lysophospholipase L1-like esterase